MTRPKQMTVDGNEAAASVAYRINEIAAIYPITPSSTMGELADEWTARGDVNIWGRPVTVVEMQSEGGAAGTVHGALQAGALATTFTASQGLLLMIPNMYKIAGELTSYCMHVAARTIATHALSIFGDHSDVMACRQIGFGLMGSGSVQEAHDFALIAQIASFRSRIPFLHFFDGFRTSHEVAKIDVLSDDDLRTLFPEELVAQHRERALTPDRPQLRGTAQNPDAFFQAREAANPFYDACAGHVAAAMGDFARHTGRHYGLFDYFGDPEAERVVILMGSGVETARETVDYLTARGEKVGVVAVRLYRPFSVEHFIGSLPRSVRSIAVLDRTKEPGAIGDPLYLDVIAALREAEDLQRLPFAMPRVIAGRYGLSSKEFSPAMVKAVFDELSSDSPRRRFTVGIVDDVTHRSLEYDPEFDIEPDDVVRAVFFGLGADGTVGANKNSIKIIGEETDFFVQGYFVYDSKKSGAMTISHLRFGPRPIRSTYLIRNAGFVACHQFNFLEKMNVLDYARPGAVVLLNSPHGPAEVWDRLPRDVQEQMIEKQVKLFVIDGSSVAVKTGMGGRVNTIMQTCFFALSGVLPREEAIAKIKQSIEKSYARKGDEVVRRNWAAVDLTLENLFQVDLPAEPTAQERARQIVPANAPDFVQRVTAVMMEGKGDLLPVSAFAPDGTWPTGTTQWERRNIALEIPIWDPEFCIQCNKCAFVCPHAAIRAKIYDRESLAGAPEAFQSMEYKGTDYKGKVYTIQVAPEDCTGCNLCVNVCPGKDKTNPKHKAINMRPHPEHAPIEKPNYAFFLDLPELDRTSLARMDVKGTQFLQPLFEYSGACAGCGETPYIKLLTQLYGDRLLIANATGCSSIYGGNLPSTPYSQNDQGRGPAWSNSLFEDNAEFGLGFRLAIDTQIGQAKSLLQSIAPHLAGNLVDELLAADQTTEKGIAEQRERVASLRERLKSMQSVEARRLDPIADYLVRKSVWLIGGDGWAFDIGYGGLDHVLSLDYDVNALVLDTEVYSNTGGQSSKATPLGAAAKFASRGKAVDKKDLGLMAMNYGHVYVASIAFGARDAQTVRALMEADAYPGPSLIIAYSHCIAHGYDMAFGLDQQKRAVDSGVWPVYRFDPRRIAAGEPPLVVDMPGGKIPVQDYMRNEARFRMVEKIDPARFRDFARRSQLAAERRIALYQHLATLKLPKPHEAAIELAAASAAQKTTEE
jgi:pyruvate-ferredoxin/flavodoxin oxidoreductase